MFGFIEFGILLDSKADVFWRPSGIQGVFLMLILIGRYGLIGILSGVGFRRFLLTQEEKDSMNWQC